METAIKRVYIESFFSSPFALRISLMKQGQIENEESGSATPTSNANSNASSTAASNTAASGSTVSTATNTVQRTEQIAFVKKIASIGLSIMSLEAVPIRVNAFEISCVYGDLPDIVDQFKGYYK